MLTFWTQVGRVVKVKTKYLNSSKKGKVSDGVKQLKVNPAWLAAKKRQAGKCKLVTEWHPRAFQQLGE